MKSETGFILLLTGIGIGAVTALLLARCSGAELRKGIRKRTGKAKHYLMEQAGTLADHMETAADAATSATGEMLDQAGVLARKAGKLIERHG
jgi:gas vesicle protein